jgi:hypothetical protein
MVCRRIKVLTFRRGPYDSYMVACRLHPSREGDAHIRGLDIVNRRFRVIVVAGTLLAGMSAANADAQFSLSGVVVVEGQSRGWLQESSLTQNRIVVVRVGESIGPYRVTKILEDRVELEGPTGTLVVRLAGAPSTPSVPTVAAVAAPEPPPPNTTEKHVVITLDPVAARSGPRVEFESLLRGVLPSASPSK